MLLSGRADVTHRSLDLRSIPPCSGLLPKKPANIGQGSNLPVPCSVLFGSQAKILVFLCVKKLRHAPSLTPDRHSENTAE